jgi:hypothetical protein
VVGVDPKVPRPGDRKVVRPRQHRMDPRSQRNERSRT